MDAKVIEAMRELVGTNFEFCPFCSEEGDVFGHHDKGCLKGVFGEYLATLDEPTGETLHAQIAAVLDTEGLGAAWWLSGEDIESAQHRALVLAGNCADFAGYYSNLIIEVDLPIPGNDAPQVIQGTVRQADEKGAADGSPH